MRTVILGLTIAAVLSLVATTAAFATHDGASPDKITICHKPGTPAEQTLEVPSPAWEKGHKKHGDMLGPCPQGSIAFRSNRDGNWEIYKMNPDGSRVTRLTFNVADDDEPSWSPDRRKIVFQSSRDGNNEIYVINSDGSKQTRITNNPAVDLHPTWSPDGTKITFSSTRDGNEP